MTMAHAIAGTSTSTRLQVGCILVKDRAIIAEGLNGSVKGWPTNGCEGPDGLTHGAVVHAEANAVLKAARLGRSTEGATAFITHSCCEPCALMLAGSGISKVVYQSTYRCTKGLDLLRTIGVEVLHAPSE